jgi:pantoate--beta-alanine ligase
MKTVKSKIALEKAIRGLRRQGKTVALVPTMGALHDGHVTLMQAARRHADVVVVYIFVNPRQFGPNEDFDRYPRPWKKDMAICRAEGIDLLYAPPVEDVYPEGYSTNVSVGGVSEELDGAHRPGHFDGVATVLAKMFIRIAPDVALLGEKDYQQLQVVKKLVRDLDLPLKVVGVPTVREASGLARSSRNQYLSEEQKSLASALYAEMKKAAENIAKGADIQKALEAGRQALLAAGFRKIDYFELRDAATLAPVTALRKPARLLAAAYMGTTRLIDNMAVKP